MLFVLKRSPWKSWNMLKWSQLLRTAKEKSDRLCHSSWRAAHSVAFEVVQIFWSVVTCCHMLSHVVTCCHPWIAGRWSCRWIRGKRLLESHSVLWPRAFGDHLHSRTVALPVYVWSSALQTALAVEHSSHTVLVLDVSTVRLPTAIVQVKSEVCMLLLTRNLTEKMCFQHTQPHMLHTYL